MLENPEKKIRQYLMNKDKKRIIDLYFQIKFEKDIFEQQAEELRQELNYIRDKLRTNKDWYDLIITGEKGQAGDPRGPGLISK